MLGWEFPPHISGGLGTACLGLTQGLAHVGVEVLFVVPRAHGDEDARFAKILGANQISVPDSSRAPAPGTRGRKRSRTAGRVARPETERLAPLEEQGSERESELDGDRATPAGEPTSAPSGSPEDEAVYEALRVLAIESPLLPYLGEEAFEERVRDLARRGVLGAQLGLSGLGEEARASVEELARLLGGPDAQTALRESAAGWDAPTETAGTEAEVARERAPELRTRTLDFTGAYGPGLFEEVSRYALVIGELARRERFDVIHAHDWMTYPAGLLARKLTGKPLVVHMHACEYDRSGEHVNERIRRVEQIGLDGADRIVCVSHYTANILRRRYGTPKQKLRVVHNAVTHKEQLEGWHAEKTIPEPIVLFLGRVTFQKGPDYFLEAAARVIQIERRVKFVVSGSGDMLPTMVERAARLGLARHVHFTGFLRGAEVERMYAMADIYVMPSVSEPFGISPLEAMALDVPVIVSRQSGVSEVLRNALKVDFWDVQEIANKILALLAYPALREELLEEGKEEVRTLRWDVRGQAVRDIYAELLR
jgi:glycogen synthase